MLCTGSCGLAKNIIRDMRGAVAEQHCNISWKSCRHAVVKRAIADMKKYAPDHLLYYTFQLSLELTKVSAIR
jgi:hypothetical protein